MARKLKTYETSIGFFDLAIAAPSMKAALEAWGADSNLFHQGAARESEDPDVVSATMKTLGIVLKRPVGSKVYAAAVANVITQITVGCAVCIGTAIILGQAIPVLREKAAPVVVSAGTGSNYSFGELRSDRLARQDGVPFRSWIRKNLLTALEVATRL